LVQAGSFRDPENARYLARDLVARGFEAHLVEKTVGEVRYYRVVVGREQSSESAQALILRLKDAGFEGFLLLEEGLP
jgi:cell division protein FtsN